MVPGAAASWIDPPSKDILIGYLTWDDASSKFGIAWDPHAPTADPGGRPPAPDPAGTRHLQYAVLAPNLRRAAGDDVFLPPDDHFPSQPLPAEIRIDATRLIQLELYLWNEGRECVTPSNVPPAESTTPQLEVELRAGTRVLAGGIPTVSQANPGTAPAGYCRLFFGMPSELGWLAADDRLHLTIRHINQPDHFRYGLQGSHRSVLRIPIFSIDELVFREPDRYGLSQETTDDPEPQNGTLILGFLPLLAAPLGRTRASRRAILLAAVFAITLLSGCAGRGAPSSGTSEVPQGRVDVRFVPTGVEAPSGQGSLSGVVMDVFGYPIPGARVSILGTTHFTDTGDWGHFRLQGIAAGTHEVLVTEAPQIRAVAPVYHPIRSKVDIRDNQITSIVAHLIPLVMPSGDAGPHRHDYWAADAFKARVLDKTVSFTGTSTCGAIGSTSSTYCVIPGPEFYLPPDPKAENQNLILPGTQEIEVKVSWESSSPLHRVGVYFRSAFNSKNAYLLPKENGETTRIRTEWEMTDKGHQWGSRWTFGLYVPGHDVPALNRSATNAFPPLHVEIGLRKGTLPIDGGHPDLWRGNESLELANLKRSFSCSGGQAGQCNNRYSLSFFPNPFVPMETRWMELRLNWSAASTIGTWQGTMGTPLNTTGGCPRPIPGREADSKAKTTNWTIQLGPAETDSPYVKKTGWAFCLIADPSPLASMTTYVRLIAHRDPMPEAPKA